MDDSSAFDYEVFVIFCAAGFLIVSLKISFDIVFHFDDVTDSINYIFRWFIN